MQVPDIINNKWTQLASVTIVAFAGGYILGKRNGKIVVVPPKSVIENSQPSLFDQGNTTIAYPEEIILHVVKEAPLAVNVFTITDEDWDYEAELATRGPNEPYILHADEYVNDEMGFTQETVTYYAGDDIMANIDDTPIYNHAGIMGDLRFGHGSKDPSVVYIRNEKLQHEWEVLLHTGSFEIEVMGLEADQVVEDEVRHSGVQKFRRE